MTMTFGTLFDTYYERHAMLRTRCPENARYFYQRHGVFWKNYDVSTIRRPAVRDWMEDIGATRGNHAANRALNLFAAVINWGIKREYVSCENPCVGVDRFEVDSRERFLLPSEFESFKSSLNREPTLLQNFFWMLLLTGARRGNVLAMRWEEIDFTLQYWCIGTTKNGKSHYVALTPASLLRLAKMKPEGERTGWVFPGPGKTGHIVDPKRAWHRIIKRANLKDLRIHDLRRTVGSYLAINGANSFLIGQVLGHKDPRSTMVYARLTLEPVRAAVANIQSSYFGDMKP